MPSKIEGYECLACGRKFLGPNALHDAEECEKKDAVRWAHTYGLHAWYCLNCRRFYRGKIGNAKCPKCSSIGKRICRGDCRGKQYDWTTPSELIPIETEWSVSFLIVPNPQRFPFLPVSFSFAPEYR